MYKKKNNAKFSKAKNYMSNSMYDDHATGPLNEGSIQTGIALLARKGLPKSSYSIKADPYTAALPEANPYDLIAPFNRTVGGHYAGTDNLDGGNVSQYANSYSSKMLHAIDFGRMKLYINYRYLPTAIKEGATASTQYFGSGLVDMQRQSISEAVSVLQSTTFTQMAINHYVVETDMAMGSAKSVEKTFEKRTFKVYDDITDVIYAASRFYQIYWQEGWSLVSWLNSFRLKQGTLIRSSWNRETPILNSLFGLFNKKAFLSLFDSICLSFQGEYIDHKWKDQVNLLSLMPSRRSNSINDPVLELQVMHMHPKVFRMYLVNDNGEITGKVFDLDDQKASVEVSSRESVDVAYFDAVEQIKDKLSAQSIAAWARDAKGNYPTLADQNAYYNYVVGRANVVNSCFTKFKQAFSDVREVFDTIGRTGLNTWVKKTRPSITKDTDAPLYENLIVTDIMRTVFSGPVGIKLNENTKRWSTFTLWNIYNGVPSFDAKSGGAFLTFSGKTIDAGKDYDHVKQWIPIAFYVEGTNTKSEILSARALCYLTNRVGSVFNITVEPVVITSVPCFKRLAPLSTQDSLSIRCPTITNDQMSTEDQSFVQHTLDKVFGYSCVNTHYSVDPDLFAIYQLEINDVTNDCIRYARANAAFKGAESESSDLGFDTFGQTE